MPLIYLTALSKCTTIYYAKVHGIVKLRYLFFEGCYLLSSGHTSNPNKKMARPMTKNVSMLLKRWLKVPSLGACSLFSIIVAIITIKPQ
jgi:hypothetical protein